MKRILIALLAIIGLAAGAQAQRANLYFGYGGYTQMDACDMHDGGGKVNTAWGAVTAGVNFQVAPRFQLGPSYTFSSSSFKHHDTDIYYHVIMLNGRYDYYRNRTVTLYAHLGVGVDISHLTNDDWCENKAYFAVQATPLGAEAAIARNVAFFGELGFGAQGLLQVGFRFKL